MSHAYPASSIQYPQPTAHSPQLKALVTGGGGFLGRYIVEQLRARGDAVTVFGRGTYPELEALGVRVVRGDLQDAEAVKAACAGIDVIFRGSQSRDVGAVGRLLQRKRRWDAERDRCVPRSQRAKADQHQLAERHLRRRAARGVNESSLPHPLRKPYPHQGHREDRM